MADLSVQDVTASGLAPTYAAAGAGGDTFTNNGRVMLHVKNGGSSSIDVTITRAKTCSFGFTHNVAISIAAGSEKMIGPFPTEQFTNDQGKVAVGYSAVTSVTVAALDI